MIGYVVRHSNKETEDGNQRSKFKRREIQALVLVLVIPAVVILSILHRLNDTAVAAILSGIVSVALSRIGESDK